MADQAGATSYKGTRVLDAPLSHPSRQLRLLALDAWDELFVLRGIEAPATTMPFPDHDWTIQTDQGTLHRSAGARVGARDTIRHWDIDVDSPLPDNVTRIVLSPGLLDGQPAPTTTLATPPASIARPATTSNLTDSRRTAGCSFCNPLPRPDAPIASGPRCPACWAAQRGLDQAVREAALARPRVIALSADLGNLAATDIALCSIDAWPTWFDLTLGAQSTALAGRHSPRLGGRWDIEDERGNHYAGLTTSGGSGTSRIARATCAPALDPRAQTLTITFPDPFGQAGIITTTVTLTR